MNSRQKGKRGERAWRDELRAHGFDARRGQQFCGSPDSPDVVCEALADFHFEVKRVERLNINDAMDQARRDCREKAQKVAEESTSPQPLSPCGEGNGARLRKVPVVAHRRSFCPWLVTVEGETFFRLLRGDFLECGVRSAECRVESSEGNGTNATNGTNGQAQISDLASQARLELGAPGRTPASRAEVKGLSGPESRETTTTETAA